MFELIITETARKPVECYIVTRKEASQNTHKTVLDLIVPKDFIFFECVSVYTLGAHESLYVSLFEQGTTSQKHVAAAGWKRVVLKRT